jgi:hypothetical protein
MRRTVILFATLAATLFLVAGTAYSDDFQPPTTVLMKGTQELQMGRLGSYCWPTASGFGCSDTFISRYPAADLVRAGSRLHIRINKAQRPETFNLYAARKVNERGWMVRPRQLNVSLQPLVEGGQTVAWDAFFYVNRPGRHYYIRAEGFWDDAAGGQQGDASWTFHVKTRG